MRQNMENDCTGCKLVDELREEIKQCQKDIGKLYTANAEIRTDFNNIKNLIEKIDIKIDKMLSKPSARWETIVSALIGAVIAYIVASILK